MARLPITHQERLAFWPLRVYHKITVRGKRIKIAPSIVAADFARLGDQVAQAEAAGADYIHIDVMDGVFVPNISVGLPAVEALRRVTRLPLDVHLMIARPEGFIKAFAEAGADIITVHQECSPHLHRTVEEIKQRGKRAGVALNPATPLSTLEEILPYLDLVLIMTVDPGFTGQDFIPSTLTKIERLSQLIAESRGCCELEVDGGINPHTAPKVAKAGAEVLVAGSAIFSDPDGIVRAIERLRDSVTAKIARAAGNVLPG